MSKQITNKIILPERIKNPSYSVHVDNDGIKRAWYGQPEFLTLKDKNQDLLEDAFSKIESLIYSDHQLKSINQFLLDNYKMIASVCFAEDSTFYNYFKVYKRYDDILFRIHEVCGANMTINDRKHLFPFLGGVIELSEQIKFHPEDFGFEHQFHVYNESEKKRKEKKKNK